MSKEVRSDKLELAIRKCLDEGHLRLVDTGAKVYCSLSQMSTNHRCPYLSNEGNLVPWDWNFYKRCTYEKQED